MVSKSSAVRSIRLQNDLWAWLTEEAARREVAVNALVADLLLVGRLRAEEAAAAKIIASKRKPAKPVSREITVTVSPEIAGKGEIITYDVPIMQRRAFNPQPKKGSKK